MRKSIPLWLASLFLGWIHTSPCAELAQRQPAIRCLTLSENLSSTWVYAAIKDQDGYIWAATGNGLNRYDGYGVKAYLNNPSDPKSIGSNRLKALAVDAKGALWTGGTELNKFDGRLQRFFRFDVSDGRPILAIHQDSHSRLWIGGSGFGLRQIDPDTGKVIRAFQHIEGNENSLGDDQINKIAEDSEGNIWIATLSGLTKLSVEKESFLNIQPAREISNFPGNTVRSLYVTKTGRIWATTEYGLLRYDIGTRQIKSYRHDPNDSATLIADNIWSVHVDRFGRIWIGTDKNGIDLFDASTEKFSHYEAENLPGALPSGSIYNIVEDADGVLWLPIFNFGLCRFSVDDRHFNHYQKHGEAPMRGLSFNNVMKLHEDRKGIVWIALDGGGLNRFDPHNRTFEHYRHDPNNANSLSSDSVLSITEDSAGMLWIGTWGGGLNRFDPIRKVFTRFKSNVKNASGLLGDNIYYAKADLEGYIWLSVWDKGLQRLDPKTMTFTSLTPYDRNAPYKIANRHINFVHHDRQGNMWVGGFNGLERVDKSSQVVQTIQLNKQNDLFDVHEASDGVLWFATGNGLVRYDPATNLSKSYDKAHGIGDNCIVGIEVDDIGMLWLGTRRGLSRFDPRSGLALKTYGPDDGLQSWEFNRFSHLKTRDGTFYFGGPRGLNQFLVNSLPSNPRAPKVLIDDFEVFNMPAPIGDDALLPQSIRFLSELFIPYATNNIAFRFSSLDFTSPQRNRYRYKLEGFDSDWTDVGSEHRYAQYTNLKPGTYTFRVLGSNNDGVWSTDGDRKVLHILPAWWMTWPARVMAFLAVLGLMYLGFRARIEFLSKRQAYLESLIDERTTELQQAKVKLESANQDLEVRVNERTATLQDEIRVRRGAEQALLQIQSQLSELSHELISQEKRTQQRIAQDLHDHLGQTIAVARMRLEATLAARSTMMPAELQEECSRISALLEQAMREVRQVLVDLRPPLLEDEGLKSALDIEVHARDFAGSTTDVILEVADSVEGLRWPGDVEYGVFMVAREAVANALHHARASLVRVILEGNRTFLSLDVIDDGVGIPADMISGRPGHLGMVGMRERSRAIGARFEVEAQADGGTRVSVRWGESGSDQNLSG